MDTIMFSNEMQSFISRLSQGSDTLQDFQEAVECVAKSLGIGKIHVHLVISKSGLTPNGEKIDTDVYVSKKGNDEQCIEKEYHSKEPGIISYQIYHAKGGVEWDEQVRKNIDNFVEVLFVYMGRFRLQKQVEKNQVSDYMTGLPNADGFIHAGNTLEKKGEITGYAAVYFNLRDFKLVNMQFTYSIGDYVIREYANYVSRTLQGEEVLARFGGDNFAAIVHKEKLEAFLDMLAAVPVEFEFRGKRQKIYISATCGVYEIEPEMSDMVRIMAAISMALQVAKYSMKHERVVYFNDELNAKVLSERVVVARFEQALANREFEVYYQPKVDIENYAMIGAEALIRWKDGDTLRPPNTFIPVLEQEGAICQLDLYVLECNCRNIRKWINAGISPVCISSNFSRKHFHDKEIAEKIRAIIDKYQIPPEYIEIEVTETVEEGEGEYLKQFIGDMKNIGVKTSIDDFGTGYSSLNILRYLPVDVLKIDRSFISENLENQDKVVLSHIVRLSNDLGIEVITEGVENMEQVELLKDLQCRMVQGFLFDKPLQVEEFEKRLTERKYDLAK